MSQLGVSDVKEAVTASIPDTVTSLKNEKYVTIANYYDDFDLLHKTTTLEPVCLQDDGVEERRIHIKQLFRKFISGFHTPRDIAKSTSNKREEATDLASIQWRVAKIPVPSLTIAILVVGTRGDIQPFLAIGYKLKQEGHSVRLATHRDYEDLVKAVGLDFFPLGGDPRILCSCMAETNRFMSIPKIYSKRKLLTESVKMMDGIIQSTWLACTSPCPDDLSQKPWVADAIIANPVCYGHLHCAEALGVPLHLFFPQPWIPTSEFPHPLFQLSYERGCRIENWYSYHIVEWVIFQALGPFINNLRRSIGLEPVRAGECGYSYMFDSKVPFAKIWSASLVSKPKDWGPHVDIIGNIFHDEIEKILELDFVPPSDLVDFLEKGASPIFMGFGSVNIEDTLSFLHTVTEAVKGSGERVVIQSSWGTFCNGIEHLDDAIFFVGAVPHGWLFPRVAAVIHHGGAGTVAAGLRAGKPTMICPVFGDQFFYGHYCYEKGVGPKPVPFRQLTSSKLVAGFEILRLESVKKSAETMAKAFSCENGVEEGVRCFYKYLPLKHMVCDVSLYLKGDRTLTAKRWCQDCELKLSILADEIIHSIPENMGHYRTEYQFMKWAVKGPVTPLDGAIEGVLSLLYEITAGISDFVMLPVQGARRNGAVGAMKGLCLGIFHLAQCPIRGGVLLVDKFLMGMVNFVHTQRKRIKNGSSLPQAEFETVQDQTASRYTLYSGIKDWELAMKCCLFGDSNVVTQQNVDRVRTKVVKVNEGEVYQDISEEELKLAFSKTKYARKFFNALSCGNPTAPKDKVIIAVNDLVKDYCSKLNGDGNGSVAISNHSEFFAEKMDVTDFGDNIRDSIVVLIQALRMSSTNLPRNGKQLYGVILNQPPPPISNERLLHLGEMANDHHEPEPD